MRRGRFAGALGAFLPSLVAIVVGLLFGFVILLVSNPAQAVRGLGVILAGGFSGGMKGVGQTLYYATPIILTGLSVGFAFKTGLFNIGASGQLIVGGFAAVYVGANWTFLPGATLWITALIVALLAGCLWALIPGLFKAVFNVNEVISCIMLNYIGMYGVNYLIKNSNVYDQLKNQTVTIASNAALPAGGLNQVFYEQIGKLSRASSVNIGLYIALIAAAVVFVVLKKTTFGYELKACGLSRDACRYAGINEKKSIVASMLIAGALSGLAGAVMYLAPSDGMHIRVEEILSPQGFNGIPVALLGLSDPIGVVLAGLFVAHITQGGYYLQKLDFMPEIIDIIIGAIIYFSAFALIVRGAIENLARRRAARRDSGKGGDGQ